MAVVIMSLYSFEDLDIYLTDFAVAMTWQSLTIKCIFSEKHDPLAFSAGGRDISAVVKLSDVPGVAQGQAVVIDGRNFSIEEILPIHDGQMLKLRLEQ